MQRITRMELRFRRAGTWVRSDEIDGASLVDAWLAEPRLRCCSFQGGLFIDVDGEPWSDEGTVDEFWMTLFWFHAVAALDRGAASFGEWTLGPAGTGSRDAAGPWEESSLKLLRDGERLEMVDVHHSGHVSMRSVVVDYDDFARRVGALAEPFASLLRACRRVAMERLPPEDQKRSTILENVLDEESLAVVAQVAAR